MANNTNSLSHTKWICKYHIVIVPKYRRKIIYNQTRKDRFAGDYKNAVQIQRSRDYIGTYDARPCAPTFKNERIKFYGISGLMMFDKHANLKYKFGNRHFWAEGYYVSTVGFNESTINKYIQDQEKADIALDKLSVREYADPFS